MNTMSISRRKFAQLLGAGAAAALVRPKFSFAKPTEPISATGGVIRLSANENPYGPSAKALKAMTDSFGLACRYPDEHNNVLIDKLAKLNGVNHDEILLGDGSGEILKLCAETFTGKEHGPLIAADPTFEAILKNASANGAEVVNDDSCGRSVLPLCRQPRLREHDPTRQGSSKPDCVAHVFKNLRHGGPALRLLRCAKGNDRPNAAAANVGQREHYGVSRCEREPR